MGGGAISRYLLSLTITILSFQGSPTVAVSVLLVNLIGSFAAGWWMGNLRSTNLELLLVTGFLGSFTTFSAFSKESFVLLETKNIWWFMGFVLLNILGALLSLVLGYYLNR